MTPQDVYYRIMNSGVCMSLKVRRNICSLTKKSPHESQQKSCLFRVIPNIYLRNLCSVTKDSPQESQQKRLSFLFRGGAWSSLSHMSEYPKCLSKGIIHILRNLFIWHCFRCMVIGNLNKSKDPKPTTITALKMV